MQGFPYSLDPVETQNSNSTPSQLRFTRQYTMRFFEFLNNPYTTVFHLFTLFLMIACIALPYCMSPIDCSAMTIFQVEAVTMNPGGLNCTVQGSLQDFQTQYNLTVIDRGLCGTYAPKIQVSACYNFFDKTRSKVILRPTVWTTPLYWTTPLLVVGGSILCYLALIGIMLETERRL